MIISYVVFVCACMFDYPKRRLFATKQWHTLVIAQYLIEYNRYCNNNYIAYNQHLHINALEVSGQRTAAVTGT